MHIAGRVFTRRTRSVIVSHMKDFVDLTYYTIHRRIQNYRSFTAKSV